MITHKKHAFREPVSNNPTLTLLNVSKLVLKHSQAWPDDGDES